MAYRRAWAAVATIALGMCAPALAWANGGAGGEAGQGGSAGASGAGAGGAGAGGAAGAQGGAGGKAGQGGASGQAGSGGADPGYPVAGKGTPGAIVATACAEGDPWRCMAAQPLVYSKKVELPIAFDWDTNWIPDNSPLQVRFYAKLPAFTQVDMKGGLEATWPEPITLDAFSLRGTGHLSFDYGLQIGAKAKIGVEVLGQDIKWEGDIPFVPKVDFHVKGDKSFDPWAWDPGILATGYTPKLTLFTIDITDAIIPVPGIGGGILLDVQGELGVRYTTERIVILPANGTVTPEVKGPITGPDMTTRHVWQQGAWGEYTMHPEGKVHYGGAIHLIPSFYIEVLGKKFSIPIYDYKYPVEIADQEWIFDDQLVHVPLPDVRADNAAPITAPKVLVGQAEGFKIKLTNVGEATLRVEAKSDTAAFKVLDAFAEIEPGKDTQLDMRFAPKIPGPAKGKLTVTTNDPDSPELIFDVQGEADPEPEEPAEMPDAGRPPSKDAGPDAPEDHGGELTGSNAVVSDSGGCGCRSAGSAPATPGFLPSSLLLFALLLRRRPASIPRRPPTRPT